MKTFLAVLGGVFLVVIVGFAGILVWSRTSGSDLQAEFFNAVLSGDPNRVMAMMDPALKSQIDEPVMAAWMQAVKQNLGAYKGLSKTNFDTSARTENGLKIVESKGEVLFEKGTAQSELVSKNGLIVKFEVVSDKLPKGWFKGPAGTGVYRDRAKQFLTAFLTNQPDQAFALMHENLQKKAPLERLKAMMSEQSSVMGKPTSVAFQSEQFQPADECLQLTYKVDAEKAPRTALVEFQFQGMKGHLVAFKFMAPSK